MSRSATENIFYFRRFLEDKFNLKIEIEDKETHFEAVVYKEDACIATFEAIHFVYLNTSLMGFYSGYKACLKTIASSLTSSLPNLIINTKEIGI